MSSEIRIITNRQRRHDTVRRSSFLRIGLGCSGAISLVAAIIAIVAAFIYVYLTSDLPNISILPNLLDPPDGALLQPTRLFDSSGEHQILSLENPVTTGKEYLYLEPDSSEEARLPDVLISTTLAAVDPQFWGHRGYYLASIINESQRSIAQRLASDLLLQGENPGPQRTIREWVLASHITTRFGRTKVLEWYINHTNYGYLAFGADAAARLYFGKPASKISLAESALLAAIGENPRINPLVDKQASLVNQRLVIQKALQYRLVSPDNGMQAINDQLVLMEYEASDTRSFLITGESNLFPSFSSLVLNQLEEQIPRERIERGGIQVVTTLDYELQQQATCAAAVQLARLDNPEAAAFLPEDSECQAAQLLPTLTFQSQYLEENLDISLAVLEPGTGRLLTLVSSPLPSAVTIGQRSSPLGSMITPFIYLTAFTRGFGPATMVWDIPQDTPANNELLSNFIGEYHGPIRLRIALVNDYLAPSQRISQQVGANNVRRTARQFGLIPLEDTISSHESLVYESTHVTLLQVCQAFAVFANQGVMAGYQSLSGLQSSSMGGQFLDQSLQPVSIISLEDPLGQLSFDKRRSFTRPIITPQLAYLMSDILSDEAARWPSLGHPNNLEIGRPAAVKIGQTQSSDSNWVIGYTPQLLVGSWLSLNQSQTIEKDPPSDLINALSGLWHAVSKYAHRDLPYQSWTIPPGISNIEVCDPSGLLPTDDCPNTVQEIFLEGSEPTQIDTFYRSHQINRETGRLATVFTSSDQLDNRVFFLFPPEAEPWALASGISIPPESYDSIPLNLPKWSNAAITQPEMFEVVRGQVNIAGTADAEQLDFFRIQVGSGLNPITWLQLDGDSEQGVIDGQLGVWDTKDLNGLFAIQLLVVEQDQKIQRVTALVTVDNTPPEIRITYPSQEAQISATAEETLIIQAEAQDDLSLESVVFYLNDQLLATLFQQPFAVPWTIDPGEHILRVIATDQAGNTSEETITFNVD